MTAGLVATGRLFESRLPVRHVFGQKSNGTMKASQDEAAMNMDTIRNTINNARLEASAEDMAMVVPGES